MNISGAIFFNADNSPNRSSSSTPIANVAVALQLKGNTAAIGTYTDTGIVTTTDVAGTFTFTGVPAGDYRVVEAAGYTGTTAVPGVWSSAATIAVTPKDPDISAVSNAPSQANKLMSLSPNTRFVTVASSDVSGLIFIDVPLEEKPLEINNYVTTGENLILAGDNGTFGSLPNGTAVQTSNPNGSPPYSDFTTAFSYVHYVYFKPNDGEYSISNTITNTNFRVWFNTSDHGSLDENGRMMIVNGNYRGQSIFATQVTVEANTDYVFSSWVMNVDSNQMSVLPELRVTITGSQVIFDQLLTDVLSVTAIPTWVQVGVAFNSGDNTSLKVAFISEGGAAGGNDYLVDDLTLYELEPAPVTTIQKTASASLVNPGDTIQYTITFTNTGAEELTNVIFKDLIPAGTTFVPKSLILDNVEKDGVNLATGVDIGNVQAKQTITIVYKVTVDSNVANGTILTNTGNITYSYVDSKGVTQTATSVSNPVQTGVLNPSCPICPMGPSGAEGPAGSTGPVGARGFTGAEGPTGPSGARGFTGASGCTGPAGERGLTGRSGCTGPAGARGLTGRSGCTGPAGERGFIGAAGDVGPIGPTGSTGPAGARGVTGAAGDVGPTGARGPTGPIGPIGPIGLIGPIGPAGSIHNMSYLQATSCVCQSIEPGQLLFLGKTISQGGDRITYDQSTEGIVQLASGSAYFITYKVRMRSKKCKGHRILAIGIGLNGTIYPGSVSSQCVCDKQKAELIASVIISVHRVKGRLALINLSDESICISSTNLVVIQAGR